MVDDDFVARRVRAGHREFLRVLGIFLRLGFGETLGGVRLLAENFAIAPEQLRAVAYTSNPVRHLDRETSHRGDRTPVAARDRRLEFTPEGFYGGVALRRFAARHR